MGTRRVETRDVENMSNEKVVDLCLQRSSEPGDRRDPKYSSPSSDRPLNRKQMSSNSNEETWAKKPTAPSWIKTHERLEIKRTPENERMPKVCPRFLLENRRRWDRIEQEWEPILDKIVNPKNHTYKPSHCPFHKGYEI